MDQSKISINKKNGLNDSNKIDNKLTDKSTKLNKTKTKRSNLFIIDKRSKIYNQDETEILNIKKELKDGI